MNRTIEENRDLRKLRALQKRLWRSQTGWTGHIMVASFSLFVFVVVAAVGKANTLGAWLVVGFAVLYGSWPLLSYMRAMQKAEKKFLEGPEKGTYVFTDTGLILNAEIGNTELFWGGLTDIFEFPEGDILEFKKRLRLMFPTPMIDEEIRPFLHEHLALNLSKEAAVAAGQPKAIDY